MKSSRIRRYRRGLVISLLMAVLSFVIYVNYYIENEIPDSIRMNLNETVSIKNFGEIIGESEGNYDVDLTLFGMFNVKTVNVDVTPKLEVMPCGFPVGIYLETDGVMVIDTGTLTTEDGLNYEPALDKVYPEDYIIALNDITVSSKSQLIFLVNKYGHEEIELTVRRGEDYIEVNITPVEVKEDDYKLGIWVRDDTQGIGTMTYITRDYEFGALGHGISDVDTGKLLNCDNGLLYRAKVWGIKRGVEGTPGGLCGSISYDRTNILGEINNNCAIGIYGKINYPFIESEHHLEYMEVAYKQDIKTGKAYIRSKVSGEIEDYEIEIEEINYNDTTGNKQLVIKVVDRDLLDLTGGIVQGMSGSPIIQNGKLIGAVTHVLVKDPSKGYGIFIEEMLEHD